MGGVSRSTQGDKTEGEKQTLGIQSWSFKEKLMGCKNVQVPTVKRDLLKEKLVSIEYIQGDHLKP